MPESTVVPLTPPAQPVSYDLDFGMLISFKAGASRDDDARENVGKEPELLVSRFVRYLLPEVGQRAGELGPNGLGRPLVCGDMNLACFSEGGESRLLAVRN